MLNYDKIKYHNVQNSLTKLEDIMNTLRKDSYNLDIACLLLNEKVNKVIVYVNKHEDSKVNAINNIGSSAVEVKEKDFQIHF